MLSSLISKYKLVLKILCSVLLVLYVSSSFIEINCGGGLTQQIITFIVYLGYSIISIFAIFSLDNLVAEMKKGISRLSYVYGAVLAGFMATLYNPIDAQNTQILKFTREIGQGVIAGYDVSRVINNFLLWIILFGVFFILYTTYINRIRATFDSQQQQNTWRFLDNFVVLMAMDKVLVAIGSFYQSSQGEIIINYGRNILDMVFLSMFLYIILKFDRRLKFNNYRNIIMIFFALGYIEAILLPQKWNNGTLLLGCQCLLMTIFIIYLYAKKSNFVFIEKHNKLLEMTLIIFSLIPLILSLYIEGVNILNQYGIFVVNLTSGYILSLIVLVIICSIFFAWREKKGIVLTNGKRFAYPYLIFGIAMLSIQVPLTDIYSADVFEGGNYAILINDFLNFGSIPIIEHYGGHMMTSVWEGLLYGFVNQDFSGAAYSPYSNYCLPIIVLCFYYFVKYVWDEDMAFWTVLCFPFYSYWSYFGLGMVLVVAIIAYVRKSTYLRATLIWLACIWLGIYRLDLGFAFIIAGVLTLAIYVIVKKDKQALRKLLVSLACCAVICIAIWCTLCFIKNINPVERLLEFLMISASNYTWAYEGIGDNRLFAFGLGYLVFPFCNVIIVLYMVLNKSFRNRIGYERWVLLLVFGVAYFANFQRSLVRHSLMEMAVYILFFSGFVFVSAFVGLKLNRKLFLPVFTACILLLGLLQTNIAIVDTDISTTSAKRIGYFVDGWKLTKDEEQQGKKTIWMELAENKTVVDRVQSLPIEEKYSTLTRVLDLLLNDDQTYVDFTATPLTYIASQRPSPVYVSQSPHQLSREYTQKLFIDEISKNPDKNPICLLPSSEILYKFDSELDGIMNNSRYYLVAEYIYQNYVPLITLDEFAIWCLPEYYQKMLSVVVSDQKEHIGGINEEKSLFKEYNCTVDAGVDSITLKYTGSDPQWWNLHEYLELSDYVGDTVSIIFEYTSDKVGNVEVFYTTEKDEEFNGNKVITREIQEKGMFNVELPVTEYSRLRLDIPEESTVTITSMKVSSLPVQVAQYGYDQVFHNYNMKKLPLIWAELDERNAAQGEVVTTLTQYGNCWTMQPVEMQEKMDGNYLLITAEWHKNDDEQNGGKAEEYANAKVSLGIKEGEQFDQMYEYNFLMKEGEHQYLIRVSSDYYWYAKEINAIAVSVDPTVTITDMKIIKETTKKQ